MDIEKFLAKLEVTGISPQQLPVGVHGSTATISDCACFCNDCGDCTDCNCSGDGYCQGGDG